ncbi:ATP-dependent DNA helicase RecG [Fontisphaera persica]|uniref:ATP-dependent DNA helicase RecG n=1 Tax=Fontisphaera persica TaxID=2974023 RepID=UPI0024BFF734|nr:ATP-dependent DNA helicase RecG [Fontisphaera persica]WCJ61234.1 ATP-dependent DNA helicase RecG [Fontisphaera persica]
MHYAQAVDSAKPATCILNQPVTCLWGVGAERAELLGKLGIQTVEDLLLHRPRRYEDRRQTVPIGTLQPGQTALVRGRVVVHGVKYYQRRSKSVYELILEDGSGRLYCHWWNLPFMEKYFRVGDEVIVFGAVRHLRPATMDHPETEVLEADEEAGAHFERITPVYPLTEGLTQRWLRGLVWRTLRQLAHQISETHPELVQAGYLPRGEALNRLHFPAEMEEVERARRRLAMEELLELQLRLQSRRLKLQERARPLPCGGDNNRLIKPFLARLAFKLTQAQTRVLREIRQDMSGKCPMRRLLQGDVGTGKTVVAACAALMALESGYDAALMAPTTLLAEQHYQTFRQWLAPLGVPVVLHISGRPAEVAGTASPQLAIGTHALLTEDFAPPRLGLVIIDEQHKFGVAQREALVRKGRYPHLLIMTATPIPRTLGLTLYGDLDVSVLDERPVGRGHIRTFVRTPDKAPKVWEFVRQQLEAGRQAYVVYPRLEEGDSENGLKALLEEGEQVRRLLQPWRVGVAHGRMPAAERERVMADFRANRTQVLLATSVIEVGVDVPNATVMVVENAERFGLAQLHQLRGRIGRGAHASYCILLAGTKTPEALERLETLVKHEDGFAIAEEDLRLRGPGELTGQAQSGLPDFRFADLRRDLSLVEAARELARRQLGGGGA